MDYYRSKRFLDTLPDWEVGRPVTGPMEHYLPRMRALLARLGNPQYQYPSLIVGGTNGKGTTAHLLAALLQASGKRVGLYTSPHLHTQRERVRIDTQIPTKDLWTEGVEQLYDATRGFEAEGLGAFSKFEALTGLAALLFAREAVDLAVFEVGLGGRYDATNAWDSHLAVLGPVGLDHTEVLGTSLEAIAADKVRIARAGRPLFTTAAQPPRVLELLRSTCAAEEVPLYLAAVDRVEGPESIRPYAWNPTGLQGRPCTFVENARLALAAAGHLLGEALGEGPARLAVESLHMPGRFERAGERPLVLLDGAHNPAAAAALAEDLQGPARAWTFVVGGSRGHDAGGVLQALRPLARKAVLTCSDHPRALSAEELASRAPAGLEIAVEPSWAQALKKALAEAGPEGRVCVTGSLHLVARAREFLGLPHERDGITEDVALESLECLEAACHRRGLPFERVSGDGNVLCVGSGRPLYFMRNKHPFNDYVAGRIAEDKGYQYEIFTRAGLPVPFTLQVFNPLADPRFDRYKTHPSVESIVEEAQAKFAFPLVVKKYRSSLAQGVFLERGGPALERRLRLLFENSGFMDNIVLVQEYVAGPEYRIVASQGELLLAYFKQSQSEGEREDLNPLHQADGRAVKVEEGPLLEEMRALTGRVARVIDLGFYAIDLIRAADGFRILELNPNPFCFFYNRDNGRADFTEIYARLLEKYAEN